VAPGGPVVRSAGMQVFLDFEASSLGRDSYPIEVGWVFADGRSEGYLIRPATGWTDWDAQAEAIHHIPRATLEQDGVAHNIVAARMIDALTGHRLYASAPSWDGKWLSVLLRAAGLPRHALRLEDSEVAQREAVADLLGPHIPPEEMNAAVANAVAIAEVRFRGGPVRHRAVDDAEEERQRWIAVQRVAAEVAGIRAA
jgi:hypothetical protein